MSKQYDRIGKSYQTFKDQPVVDIERPSVLKRLGNVDGLTCVDLACGLGYWSKLLVDKGAARVVGIDISESMVNAARESLSDHHASKVAFHVGDCSKPSVIDGGPFDVAIAGWFLNYAPDFDALTNMWRVIHDNLKPGGRFIGTTVNTHCPMFEPIDDAYGMEVWAVEEVGEGWQRGWKCHIQANVEPEPFSFENYHFMHDFYERAAAEAGMIDLKWHPTVLPDDERKDNGFWDPYLLRPHMNVVTARRSP